MSYAINFVLVISSLLWLTISLHSDQKCFDSISGLEGRCETFWECPNVWNYRTEPEYCGRSRDQVCCPSITFNEGDECIDSTSSLNGRCQKLSECDYALKYRKKPSDCDNFTVCCHPVNLRISEKMCFDYFRNIHDDAVRIELPFGKYSHEAGIGFTPNLKNYIIWECAGSIISAFFILSAARCVKHTEFGPAKWVKIRESYHLEKSYIEDANPNDFRIMEAFIHPDYTSYYNDIALFRLEKEIIFDTYCHPACLHTTRTVPEKMEVTGLGIIGTLTGNILNVIEYEICETKYRDNRKLPNGIIDELQICAGYTPVQNTICLRYNYSGKPLKYELKGHVHWPSVVAGIMSFGDNCSSPYNTFTAVYTRISAYLDWIEEIVWENEYEPETVTFVFGN